MYVLHPKFAQTPEHYIRAFLLLQRDLQQLFDFIEPDDSNLLTYSFRTHELLLRTCVEIEANFKAILKENGYTRSGNWDMRDYQKVEESHRLSAYEIRVPIWRGTQGLRRPFQAWASSEPLPWYSAYNDSKHDRLTAFKRASFANALDAVTALVVIISAQFMTHDFAPRDSTLALNGTGPRDGMESAIGDFFRVRFPEDWPTSDRYAFHWPDIENDDDPFQEFHYS